MGSDISVRRRAETLDVAVSTLYYKRKIPERDHCVRREIEGVLRHHPSYGHKRIALALKRNKKCVLRVMKLFGIKPYRRRAKKRYKTSKKQAYYANLLQLITPRYEGYVWASDFTELVWSGKKLYLATVMDLYTRTIVGAAISTSHTSALVLSALGNALLAHPRPAIFHSDNGSEYNAKATTSFLSSIGIAISRSAPGCPWENGYQESFYDKFKVEFGDPSRFASVGECTAEIYRQVHYYNNGRIHSALHMPPTQFARLHAPATMHSLV